MDKFDNSALGLVHPDFAPLVPALNEGFAHLWTPDDVSQLRTNFQSSRSRIPGVPLDGFDISHRLIPVSDGSQVEIRIYRPSFVGASDTTPILFVAHGGGTGSRIRSIILVRSLIVSALQDGSLVTMSPKVLYHA
jgi:acetyl esterase/lipase